MSGPADELPDAIHGRRVMECEAAIEGSRPANQYNCCPCHSIQNTAPPCSAREAGARPWQFI
jgi:hypothetical protein